MDNNNQKPVETAVANKVAPVASVAGATPKTPSAPATSGYQGKKTSFPPRPGQGQGGRGGFSGGYAGKKPGFRKPGDKGAFPKPDVDFKILNIRRVARITKGGKRFTFAVAVVVGNKKGSVGVGTGKAGDTSSAIDKAVKDGKKDMFKIITTKSMSIPHEVMTKYASSIVVIRPAPGKGLVAGSSARIVLTLAGITDVTSKFHSRSKNPLNNAVATINALKKLS